jgi:hypothetical protein
VTAILPPDNTTGSLGLFGNSLIQLAAAAVLADRHRLQLRVPALWRWRRFFVAERAWTVVPNAAAWGAPVVADRVVLSHAGFKAWVAQTDQYRRLAAEVGAERLSGRQLRQRFPQVSAAELAAAPAAAGDPQSAAAEAGGGQAGTPQQAEAAGGAGALAGRGLWGWFQFHSSVYSPHQAFIQSLFRLKQEQALGDALQQVLQQLRGTAAGTAAGDGGERRGGRLVLVHVRRGDMPELDLGGGSPQQQHCHHHQQQQQQQAALRTHPPFEEGQGHAWDGQGCDWRAPAAWLAAALAALSLDWSSGDLVWVCTDDTDLARHPERLLQDLPPAAAEPALPGAPPAAGACGSRGVGNRAGAEEGDGDEKQPKRWRGQADHHQPAMATAAPAAAPPMVSWTSLLAGFGQTNGSCSSGGAALGAAERFFSLLKATAGTDSTDGSGNTAGNSSSGDMALIADWFLMTRADVLLASNSTLSFTAAMANPIGGAVFLRPDPRQGGFVGFDPWNALPLLPARQQLPANHSIHRHD